MRALHPPDVLLLDVRRIQLAPAVREGEEGEVALVCDEGQTGLRVVGVCRRHELRQVKFPSSGTLVCCKLELAERLELGQCEDLWGREGKYAGK